MIPTGIIISRTDSIGDVMLTLPMCGILKEKFPNCRIYFLAKAYTRAIIETCIHVDEYINWDELQEGSPQSQINALRRTGADVIIHVFPRKEVLWLAKRAHIAIRIATGRRIYTIGKCNKLVFFSRRGSNLHEAQLNLKLLRPLGIEKDFTLQELAAYDGFSRIKSTAMEHAKIFLSAFETKKRKIILHPLSKGSASEWSLENYLRLIELLPAKDFEIFITGTKEEGAKMKLLLSARAAHVHDVTGRFTLDELIAFIMQCDALVAASTGPLHIASALGKPAIGLYSPKRPIHPGRWSPIGKSAFVITAKHHPMKGEKLLISPDEVRAALLSF